MKLTASQLRRIIKEEVSRVLSESRTEGEIMADVKRIGQEWVNMSSEFITMNVEVAALRHQRQNTAADALQAMIEKQLTQTKEKQQELTGLFKEYMEATGKAEEEVTKHMTGVLAQLTGR